MMELTPDDRQRNRKKLFFLMFAGAVGIILLIMGGYQLMEFSDSTAFCRRLCHNVMYPEYTAYQASPHSRVLCSECHVGSGVDYLVKSKLSGLPQILAVITGTYPRPIPTPVKNLRPARETCEQCHRPERFAGDLVRVHTTYLPDEQNTEKVDTRVLRVGGGELEAAVGMLPDGTNEAKAILRKAQSLSINILDDVHKLIYELRPSLLDDLGLVATVRWLAENKLEASGITVNLKTSGRQRRLSPQIETTLFRVVQETISNITRHSHAKKASISLHFGKYFINVKIIDDGIGFDIDEAISSKDRPRGLGLLGMKEREELTKGVLSIRASHDGTEINIKIPLNGEVPDGKDKSLNRR